MGDRVSIQFEKDGTKSPVLFSHWGGIGFVEQAKAYTENLKKSVKEKKGSMPLDRLEPQTVFVDFIRHITHNMERVKGDLYVGADENDGDNSDNGHHTINLNTTE